MSATVWGYPLKASVEVEGVEVDVTDAFMWPRGEHALSGPRLDGVKVLDLIDRYRRRSFDPLHHLRSAGDALCAVSKLTDSPEIRKLAQNAMRAIEHDCWSD